ncbi:tRNA pseudouridine(55) synthase TruB [Virgibacillus sp. 179-BFC.A HS]|uniref:tRNA pseudouridine synthase B n=1 Tax=Tigheibacillus jepli TaxID=3035914 RepID=A0ABU5CHS1_9BACI|nr:tRNA pseudouridine(55) synthase TruB [Virgibacillus sp. 179-BFC.A HS]MDY0405841.1 tRNA pseudouridine(55) synthase TruB [Virgibacillus sp. 179-BFC.A HS]
MDGILPLWKPKGMTSHDCVMKVRKLLHTKKVGHTGTLDPEVEGVLPICIGQATKIVPFLTDTKKTYIAEMFLGIATETEDSYGEVIASKTVNHSFTEEEIDAALNSFRGKITQIPPMYSAVKVNGKKLYEYARQHIDVERPKRQVEIYELKKLPNKQPSNQVFRLKIVCSKGTYIRTLCVDIGKKLGYPAHMSALERIQTGAFAKEDTVNFAELEKAATSDDAKFLLLPIVSGLQHLKTLEVDEKTKVRVRHGQKLPRPDSITSADPFKVMHGNELLAVYQVHPDHHNEIKPVRVFNEN